jgi:hypothetical protein
MNQPKNAPHYSLLLAVAALVVLAKNLSWWSGSTK